MKIKQRYVCNECGYVSISWIGKCPECYNWNSFVEELLEKKRNNILNQIDNLVNVKDIRITSESLINISNVEINTFFGNGITPGSVILISGEPGIGKSTFLLFLAKLLLKDELVINYFSGEESKEQIKRRCNRVANNLDNLFISNEAEIEKIIELSKANKPNFIFIDSIQTIFSSDVESFSGSVSQIKYCTSKLIQFAKKNSIPIIIIGHITKSGDIAGPKILEHMVDTVCYFEGDNKHHYRIIRLIKNRFGATDESLLFEMKENGLTLIKNLSEYFLDKDNNEHFSGKCKTIIIEGRYPIICDIEALVVPSVYSNPRRFAEGVDVSRINRITAILDKHLNENLFNFDIYVNISGGIKTRDVAVDLAIALAIYSSKNKLTINNNLAVFGELSLTGKIRGVYQNDKRVNEAFKFGLETVITPKDSDSSKNIVKFVKNISDAIKQIFK